MIFSKNLPNGTKFGVHQTVDFGEGIRRAACCPSVNKRANPSRIQDLELVKRALKIMDNDPQNFY